jgi:DNA (cytosine-5)-methyltransferase 1
MVTHPTKRSGVALNQAIELMQGILPKEFENWDEVPEALRPTPETAKQWGRFEPAIRQWETILGRPAPEPTKPDGRNGEQRLNPQFTEWLMGLAEGWITDCGLSRAEQLKACGNGVVPQQALLALQLLDVKL